MNIVLIFGYGVFNPESVRYKKYMDESIELIKKYHVQKVIFCGGFTNPKTPEISEASSMAAYCTGQDTGLKDKIILEEKSLTTLENIKNSAEIIESFTSKTDKIIIICDSIRISKIFFITLSIMSKIYGKSLTEETVYSIYFDIFSQHKPDVTKKTTLEYDQFIFEGVGMNREASEIGAQIAATMIEIGQFKYPKVDQAQINQRKKDWGLD